MTRKLFIAATVMLVALLLAAIAVVFVEFDSPGLGKLALEKAGVATGIRLKAARFRLKLARGLILENVEAQSGFPGGSYELHLDRLVLEHRLLPLLSGNLVVRRLVLERPALEILETGTGKGKPPVAPSASDRKAGPDESPGPAGASLSLEVSEIRLEDASIATRKAGAEAPSMSVEGLHLVLRDLAFKPGSLSPIHGLSGDGELSIHEVAFESMRLRDVEARLRAGDGRFDLEDLRFITDDGRFRASLSVDFNRIPFGYTLHAEGDPLDINRMTGSGSEGGFGPGRLKLEAVGFGTDSKNITGKGVAELESGEIPSPPILAAVEKALGRTALAGSPYKPTQARFRIANNLLILEPFHFETEQAGLDLSGTAGLDGPLSLQLVLRTPREGLKIKEVPDRVLDAQTTEEGWVAIPFRVTGTVEVPKMQPDVEAMAAQAARNAEKAAGERAKEGLKDLLRRKKG